MQQGQAEQVVRTRARLFVQTRHRLDVVVHDIGRRSAQNRQGAVVAATEIGHQDFNLRGRRCGADGLNAGHKVGRSAVAQIIAVHAGDHHVAQLQGGNGARQVGRLIGIERIRAAVAHVAKRAAARAFVTHDHEGRRAFAKAFANIRAGRLFANGDQVVVAQDFLDVVEAAARAGGFDTDPIGLFQQLGGLDLDRDAGQLGSGLLLHTGIVGCGGHGHGTLQGDKPWTKRWPKTAAASSQPTSTPIVERSTVRKPA